jgi:hypothetical protein
MMTVKIFSTRTGKEHASFTLPSFTRCESQLIPAIHEVVRCENIRLFWDDEFSAAIAWGNGHDTGFYMELPDSNGVY